MEKEFVPYELAVKLKALGFDEPCFGYYQKSAVIGNDTILPIQIMDKASNFNDAEYSKMGVPFCSAPTFSQAFRWFRDKKLSDMCICRYQSRDDGGIYYYYHITHDFGVEEIKHFKEGFISYEEAELACLDKLIEIVEAK